MALPFAIMGALKFRWLWIPAGVLFTGIVCSYSRGAFLSTLCALVFMGMILAGARWTGRWKVIVAPAILIGAVVLFVYLPPDPFFRRFSEASEADISTLGARLTIAGNAMPLVERYAAFGCGLGAFENAFLKVKDIFPGYGVGYAHNDYLQGLIELGGVGFAIAIILMVGVLCHSIRAVKGENRLLAIACIGAFSAILLHSLVDFNLYIPANAMALAWIAGIAQQLKTHPSSQSKSLSAGVS